MVAADGETVVAATSKALFELADGTATRLTEDTRANLLGVTAYSGTYYVQTPNNCAPIQFEDPRYDRFMAAPPKKDNARQRSLQLAKYHPKAGQVVLFESWLRHGIPEAETEDDRISISFNYDWV